MVDEIEEDEDFEYYDDEDDVGYLEVDNPEIIFISDDKKKRDNQMFG